MPDMTGYEVQHLGGAVNSELVLTVVYTGEPDEVYEFAEEGKGRLFGRDDSLCDIVIWSAINGTELSRVAGRIWRMDQELWVRNLSTRHELRMAQPGLPEEAPLPPRRDDGIDPGPARSVPGELAYLTAPGGCELLVRQRRGRLELPFSGDGERTTRVPSVPQPLRAVAAALCEPLLSGGQLPATYSEVMARAGTGTLKRTRNLVAELCAGYVTEVPQLRERIVERMRREQADLELPADPRLRSGVWTFEPAGDPAGQVPVDSDEVRRRRALALPDYYEVAHLLVRRRLVTAEDLALLGSATGSKR
jgi:hypothetical protein